jgi:transcriptional regulator of met regulon
MKPPNYVLDWMKAHNVPLTKENYLHIEYMGQEIPEGAELESELPREIQAAEIRAIRRADKKFLREAGINK